MKYNINKLPDFYSVRNYEQLDYSLEGMEGKKCFMFFDNGFKSNIIEPNKRDIKFIWDGFILFTDKDISLNDIRNGVDLFDGRLVALQRTLKGKFNTNDVRSYIANKLMSQKIPFEIMTDINLVDGYPSGCDLWSTRDYSVLVDAIDCVGEGNAYYFKNNDFNYKITFNNSKLPEFDYKHNGAIVLRGENSTAISRLLLNDTNLHESLEKIIGEDRVYSIIEGRELSGTRINNLNVSSKK